VNHGVRANVTIQVSLPLQLRSTADFLFG
jgi:hypothetical protein